MENQKIISPSICLNMIVKNEAHIILKTLENILTYIPIIYWVIADTGSQDETKNLIKEYFKEKKIPGELVEHEWVDFGYNRTKALECAFDKTDYLFIFDADDFIVGNLKLPNILNHDRYDFNFGKGFTYNRPLLINNKKKWKFIGVLHEYLIGDNINNSCLIVGDYYIISGKNGDRSKDEKKYIKDAIILKNAFERIYSIDFELAGRYAFYCAQSYRDAGDQYIEDALEWYLKCLEMNNWSQEKYFSCLMIGNFYQKKKNLNNAYKYWLKSIEYDTERIDGVVLAVNQLLNSENFFLVNLLYHKFKNYNKNPQCKLFLFSHLYNGMFEFSNASAAFHINDLESGYECCKIIIQEYILNFSFLYKTIYYLYNYKNFIDKDEKSLLLFYNFNKILNDMQKKNIYIEPKIIEIWDLLWLKNIKNLCKWNNYKITNNEKPKIFISFISGAQFNLFISTINSILNNWIDFTEIEYWFCVDENSNELERNNMKKLFGWIDYYFKSIDEKGHLKSINIIWNKLNDLKPDYWIHIDQNVIFIDKMNYIKNAIQGLNIPNVKQILFNVNYSETINDYNNKDFINLNNGFGILDPNKLSFNHTYFSLKPSLMDVKTILKLGNFDTEHDEYFEKEYANNWINLGYKSVFFDKITLIHNDNLTKKDNLI